MPNWVETTMTVQGDAQTVEAFIAKASTKSGSPVDSEDAPVSFWNFIAPAQEVLDSGEYAASHGWVDGKPSGHTPNNWYEWNTREWGTKWDAVCGESEWEQTMSGDQPEFSVYFQTAWSIPEPVFEAMVKQHPDLEFGFFCEEEQGWGAEFVGRDGVLELVSDWEIPSTHADWDERGRTGECVCSWTDQEEWFADCPKEDQQ